MPLLQIRFLPRELGHASTLTALDVSNERHPEPQELLVDLIVHVWKCEARERRADEQERTFG